MPNKNTIGFVTLMLGLMVATAYEGTHQLSPSFFSTPARVVFATGFYTSVAVILAIECAVLIAVWLVHITAQVRSMAHAPVRGLGMFWFIKSFLIISQVLVIAFAVYAEAGYGLATAIPGRPGVAVIVLVAIPMAAAMIAIELLLLGIVLLCGGYHVENGHLHVERWYRFLTAGSFLLSIGIVPVLLALSIHTPWQKVSVFLLPATLIALMSYKLLAPTALQPS